MALETRELLKGSGHVNYGNTNTLPIKFWKDPLGPWNLQTFGPTGTQEPFIPLIPDLGAPRKTLHPLDPETAGFLKHQTSESPI